MTVPQLEWRKDPVVIKISEADVVSSNADFQNNLLCYITDFQEVSPSQETINAIQNLVVATDMVEMMVEMTVKVSKAMITGFVEADISDGNLDGSDIARSIAAMRPQMELQAILSRITFTEISQMKNLTLMLHFTNQNWVVVSDAEVQKL